MDIPKIIYKTAVIIVLFLMAADLSSQVKRDDWINFTSFNDVRKFHSTGDTLFAVTSGGLLAITDPNQPAQTILNNDGLGTNDLYDMTIDADGVKWIGGFGRLIKIDNSLYEQFLFFDEEDQLFAVNRVVDDNNYLWLGTDFGLVLFDKQRNGGEALHVYDMFGDLNPSPRINDISLTNDSIWIATSDGIAVANRSDLIQLYNRNNWRSFNIIAYPELNNNNINHVKLTTAGNIYVSTSQAVFKFDIAPVTFDTSFIPLTLGSSPVVNGLEIINDSLFAYYAVFITPHVVHIDSMTVTDLDATALPPAPLIGNRLNNQRWAASSSGGIYYFDGSSYQQYMFTGLPGNDITDIGITSSGEITVGIRRVDFARFNDPIWKNYGIIVRDGATDITIDSSNQTWVGTRGNGLWADNNGSLINYDETNSSFRGNTDSPPIGNSYIYVSGLDNDGRYLYAGCYRALNNYPLVIADLNNMDQLSGWDSIGFSNGLTNAFLVDLDYHNGRVAMASESDGIFECFTGDDPFAGNIACRHLTRENSLLISNSVRAVQYSANDVLWVGTNFGLSWYDAGIDRFVDFSLPANISSDVTALGSDSRGNVWVGSKNGLAKIDAIDGTVETFTSINSDLVDDNINNIMIDNYTGNIYIATDGGFSIIPTPTGIPAYEIDKVLAFPNPFVINNSSDRLNFNFARQATVAIYTPGGERVVEMPVNLGWDGVNDMGREVASGVYIFVVTDSDGSVGRGKFLLIRK